jgi:hypothetical protein
MAMTDAERDRTLLEGFHFAIRAMYNAHDLQLTIPESEKVWDLLRDVANNKLTMASSPADMLGGFPNAKPDVAESLWRHVNKLIAQDRDTARRILAEFQRQVEDIIRLG